MNTTKEKICQRGTLMGLWKWEVRDAKTGKLIPEKCGEKRI